MEGDAVEVEQRFGHVRLAIRPAGAPVHQAHGEPLVSERLGHLDTGTEPDQLILALGEGLAQLDDAPRRVVEIGTRGAGHVLGREAYRRDGEALAGDVAAQLVAAYLELVISPEEAWREVRRPFQARHRQLSSE